MLPALNNSQLEILKILNYLKDENDLVEIRSLLAAYLSDKVVHNADKAFDEKGYITEVFQNWKNEHFRK